VPIFVLAKTGLSLFGTRVLDADQGADRLPGFTDRAGFERRLPRPQAGRPSRQTQANGSYSVQVLQTA
jgi:hypothetical protein